MTSPQLTDYQNNLVETHLGLAHKVATKFWHRAPFLDHEEFVSVAYQGLITAAIKFDPEVRPGNDPNYDPALGFGPFARIRITGAVQDWMRTNDHVPKRQRRLYKTIQESPPGTRPEETAERLGLDVAKVRAVIRAVESPPLHLGHQTLLSGDPKRHVDKSPEGLLPSDPEETDRAATANAVQKAVSQTVHEMPDFQKSVIVLRFYMGWEFAAIAGELESSPARVRAAYQEAVLLLHEVMLGVVQG